MNGWKDGCVNEWIDAGGMNEWIDAGGMNGWRQMEKERRI